MALTSAIFESRGQRTSGGVGTPSTWRDHLTRLLAVGLMTGVVSAVLAAAAVGLSGAGGQQFGLEWVALWVLGLITALVTARAAFALAGAIAPRVASVLESRRRRSEDRRFLSFARTDPRLLAEIDSAMRRSEWH